MVKSLYETYGNICEIVSETHYITGLNLMKSFWVEDANVYAAKTEWVQKFLAMDIKSDWRFGEAVNCFDATTDPPRGRHYREQGILAYDDTDEVVILGIKDLKAEVVEIPREINGKPVTVLDERCFANCSESLRKVILPDTLKEIGDYAFEYCEKLEKPEIPASVTKIGKDLFRFVSHDIKS